MAAAAPGMSVDVLLALADNALNEGKPAAACEFYDIALQQDPNHVEVLESYGEVLFHHMDQSDRAKELLLAAVARCPDEGHVKYLNLAQLSHGQTAVGFYTTAQKLLDTEHSKAKKADKADIRWQMSEVAVAVAELYLTDLCDEPNAEQACEEACAVALKHCDENIEAHQALGSLRISQERFCDAKKELRKAVDLTFEADESKQPDYDAKIDLGKLLLQVSAPDAFNYLRHCVLELNPHNAYVWFLMGEAARMRKWYHDSCRLLRFARVRVDADNADALAEIDEGIRVLVAEMGGPEAVASVKHMDDPNPLQFIPEAPSDDDDDDEEGEDDEDAAPAAADADAAA